MSSLSMSGVELLARPHPQQERVLTAEAIGFVVALQRRFNGRRMELLAARAARQKRLDAGEKPDFLPATRNIRES
jgi:malate synthase